ncbi:cytidine deaminase-like protein [Exophiala viscosa]|uniref:Cytidine deaminase-like protein n=1 Tax=Exophiala viscosa TaxID=2486360 RepID=A0AAN6DU64_9EURO|nr:cytidine deaminase-like protein [Exophiala viscosa]KAI1623889.1 cytidine deaminase-like protein [Exophiala viscosa]
MSYQSFLRATSNSNTNSPSPSSIQRKPTTASNSVAPPPTSPSAHSATTHHATPSTGSNAPHTPVSSIHSPYPTSKPSTRPETTPAPTLTPLTRAQIDAAMKTCLDLQITATTYHEKRPFAALLLGPDNVTVLLTHFSISHVQHAETELARLASIHFSQKYLATCTLVSTWEPCAMCTGTLYWSNIGRLVYAASEDKLNDLTGGHNDENMTMSLPCRDVLSAGQKAVEVIGPVNGWEQKIIEESGKWWREHTSEGPEKQLRDGSINGSERPGSLSSVRQGTPTTWTGEETVLSSINDEGEYKADLDIDWMR